MELLPMMDYKIAAIPTEYRGRQYRSRLEARWAAFFDLCSWDYEYEPIDLGIWSPDFLIHGARLPLLVEVKPISRYDRQVTAKMEKGAERYGEACELVLLGLDLSSVWLGQLLSKALTGDDHDEYDFERLCFACYEQAPDQLDFCHETQSFAGRITGLYDGGTYGAAPQPDVKVLWNRAGNLVQWHKEGVA
jgi:hypothetical protein